MVDETDPLLARIAWVQERLEIGEVGVLPTDPTLRRLGHIVARLAPQEIDHIIWRIVGMLHQDGVDVALSDRRVEP